MVWLFGNKQMDLLFAETGNEVMPVQGGIGTKAHSGITVVLGRDSAAINRHRGAS
jgi:hypothetical protein